jgi:hypothetical protein
MLPFSEQQHKVGTFIPLKVHTELIGNRLSTSPVFPSTSSSAPIHGAKALNPIIHSSHTKDLAEKITACIAGSPVAAVKATRTAECESFVAALILAVLIRDTDISHPQCSHP